MVEIVYLVFVTIYLVFRLVHCKFHVGGELATWCNQSRFSSRGTLFSTGSAFAKVEALVHVDIIHPFSCISSSCSEVMIKVSIFCTTYAVLLQAHTDYSAQTMHLQKCSCEHYSSFLSCISSSCTFGPRAKVKMDVMQPGLLLWVHITTFYCKTLSQKYTYRF